MSLNSSYNDQDLTNLLKEGEEAAFNEIYNRYALPLFYQANQMLKDQEASKDIVQEIFISLWNNNQQLKPEINLAGYLYIAVRNRVFKLLEKGKVRDDYIVAFTKYASEVSTQTLDELDERELQTILQREIDKLPPKMKEVFELSRKENLSHFEISQRLGISDKTVKKQINKALKILKLRLSNFNFLCLLIVLLKK